MFDKQRMGIFIRTVTYSTIYLMAFIIGLNVVGFEITVISGLSLCLGFTSQVLDVNLK